MLTSAEGEIIDQKVDFTISATTLKNIDLGKKPCYFKVLKHFVQFTVLRLKETFRFNSTRYSIMYHTI